MSSKEQSSCSFCVVLNDKNAHIVYEDDLIAAILIEKGAAPGHLQVFPKRHLSFLEDMTEDESKRLFFVASTASGVLFEALGLAGTNVISNSQDGKHLCLDVIPRKPNDGFNFLWEAKTINDIEMKEAQEKISDIAFMIDYKEEKKKVINLDDETIPEIKKDSNMQINHLKRVP